MKLKIAAVHEWLVTYVGSERVLEQILRLYPDADLFCLLDFMPEEERGFLKGRTINTSFIQRMPFAKKKYRNYLPFMPRAIESFDLSEYQLILSSSHAVAKGVRKEPGQLHICYCHTPMRYAWDLREQYLREAGLDRGLKGALVKAVLERIRRWDYSTASRVDYFIANSHFIKERIKRAYGREAEVIYPPVDTDKFELNTEKEDFYLAISRMVPYKKIDLIVEAFSETGRPLVVIGDGPDFDKIRAKAEGNVKLLGHQTTDVLKEYMQRARAFVFAAEEDFGIVPVEAQACGTPVIAYGKGGATETVVPLENTEHPEKLRYGAGRAQNTDNPKPTGIFFYEQTSAALIDAVKLFEANEDVFVAEDIRRNSERFSIERFLTEYKEYVESRVNDFFN
jgi:glycosyltransferase involved in cell wall biosynthesis